MMEGKSHGCQRRNSTRVALVGALTLATGMACASPVDGAAWRREILPPEKLDEQIVQGAFSILPNGGPSGEPVIEFADPVATSGRIEIDLAEIDLARYDQLHFDLWMENEATDITVTLRGYPDAHRGRRWYAFKRAQPLGQWTDIRLDLDMDDDLSGKAFDEPRKSLVIAFHRPDTATSDFARARIHRLRLVRSPVKIGLDYRQAISRKTQDGLSIVYPIQLENTTDRPIDVRLEVLPETLDHFTVSLAESALSLAPGERRTTRVELALGAAEAAKLPAGHVERAQMRVVVPELPGFDAVPIRGFRPSYLFGFVPPARELRVGIFHELKTQAQRLSGDPASYEENLRWVVEKPPSDVTPTHPSKFRCPECNSWLGLDNLQTYYCHSRDIGGRCPLHLKRVTIDRHHPLFPPMLDNYHGKTSDIARNLALGWLRTGDKRLAKRAMDILTQYQSFYRELPVVAPHSVAFQSRFRSASLFERHFLENMMDAWFILHETEGGDPEGLREIAEGLISDSLEVVNQFYYSFSASQIDIVTQKLKAAIILEKWPVAADAIGGDSGVRRILSRNFNPDGVPIDGGDYARQAARQILTLTDSMRILGIAVDEDRMRQIVRNSTLLGYLPRPVDYAMKTTVLDKTGFTILVNGAGPTLRRATINWGATRERGGHDHLTTVLYDADDVELLLRTRRVMWGHPHASLAFQSFAQNIPVVDHGNISPSRLNQEYVRDDPRAAGAIISDFPERPAYPDSRLKRSLVLFDGCLLILDHFVSSAGERLVDFPLNGLARMASQPEGMAPFTDLLGEPNVYRLPHDLNVKTLDKPLFSAQWVDGDRGVRVHALGDGFQAFVGKTYMGRNARSVPRDFLMLRTRAVEVTAAFLYEATHGEQPKIVHFVRAVATDSDGGLADDDQAMAFDVAFEDGRTVRLLISLDGGSYQSGVCKADAETRIALHDSLE